MPRQRKAVELQADPEGETSDVQPAGDGHQESSSEQATASSNGNGVISEQVDHG